MIFSSSLHIFSCFSLHLTKAYFNSDSYIGVTVEGFFVMMSFVEFSARVTVLMCPDLDLICASAMAGSMFPGCRGTKDFEWFGIRLEFIFETFDKTEAEKELTIFQ